MRFLLSCMTAVVVVAIASPAEAATPSAGTAASCSKAKSKKAKKRCKARARAKKPAKYRKGQVCALGRAKQREYAKYGLHCMDISSGGNFLTILVPIKK